MQRCQSPVLSTGNAREPYQGCGMSVRISDPWGSEGGQAGQCKPAQGSGKRRLPGERAMDTGATGSLVSEMLVVLSKLGEIRGGELIPQLQPFRMNVLFRITQAGLGLEEKAGTKSCRCSPGSALWGAWWGA